MDALLTVFAVAFDDPVAYDSARPSTAYLRRLLAQDHFIALVAAPDNTVIGGLVAYSCRNLSRRAAKSISTTWPLMSRIDAEVSRRRLLNHCATSPQIEVRTLFLCRRTTW